MPTLTNILETVLVLASPITQEELVSKEGEETVYLSRAQLDALNAQDLQTALRQVPGLGISRYGAIGSYGGAQGGSIYIRGLGTARPGGEVRMYTDGVPLSSFSPFDGEIYVSVENLTNADYEYYPGYSLGFANRPQSRALERVRAYYLNIAETLAGGKGN